MFSVRSFGSGSAWTSAPDGFGPSATPLLCVAKQSVGSRRQHYIGMCDLMHSSAFSYPCVAIRLQAGPTVGLLCGTQIGKPVLTVVPPAEGQVDSPDKGHRLVDCHHLLVVSPQQDHGRDVVRVPHHLADEQSKSSNEELNQ